MCIATPRFLKDSQNFYVCCIGLPQTPGPEGVEDKNSPDKAIITTLILKNILTGETTQIERDYFKAIPDGYSIVDPSKIIKIICPEPQKEYDKTLGERLRRCSIGRISCLARVPIYVLGGLFLSALTIVKFFVAVPVTLLTLCVDSPHLESWTFSGMIKEGIAALILFDRAVKSTLCFVFAPPTDYLSFSDAVAGTIKMTVIERKHQEVYEWANQSSLTVEEMWNNFLNASYPFFSIFEDEKVRHPSAHLVIPQSPFTHVYTAGLVMHADPFEPCTRAFNNDNDDEYIYAG